MLKSLLGGLLPSLRRYSLFLDSCPFCFTCSSPLQAVCSFFATAVVPFNACSYFSAVIPFGRSAAASQIPGPHGAFCSFFPKCSSPFQTVWYTLFLKSTPFRSICPCCQRLSVQAVEGAHGAKEEKQRPSMHSKISLRRFHEVS